MEIIKNKKYLYNAGKVLSLFIHKAIAYKLDILY